MARPFSNDMFQDGYEPNYEPDYSGIMNPELTNAVAMRKDANESAKGATDQYEADVADYKNGQATEAEEGIASLPEATNNQFTNNSFANTKFPIGPNGEPMFVGEDIDYTGMPGSPINTTYTEPNIPFVPVSTNPYTNVLASIPGEPEPVYDPYIPEESVYVPPVETVAPVYQTPTANSTDDTTTYTPPNTNSNSPAIGDIDSETGLVWDGGTFVRPESWNGNIVEDDYIWDGRDWVFDIQAAADIVGLGMPNADGSYPDGTGGGGGLQGTTGPTGGFDNEGNAVGLTDGQVDFDVPYVAVEPPYEPPPSGLGFNDLDLTSFGTAPEMGLTQIPKATYAGLDSTAPTDAVLAANLAAFQRPAGTTTESFPAFAGAPVVEEEEVTGLAYGGRVPMGNNNRLNSGLSRLPINQQNDTLTQVFQSGFRPRR